VKRFTKRFRGNAGAFMLDWAANRDGIDMASGRNGLREGKAEIDQRRPAKAGDAGDGSPDRLGGLTVCRDRLRRAKGSRLV
jgi:hypothetical protein